MFTSARSKIGDRAPERAGVGLKADHYRHIVEHLPHIGFFEIHAENYMCAGGPAHRYLTKIREHYPLSVHGVGLSIGSQRALDRRHLQRLKALNERYAPFIFSEHLAWSSHDGGFLNDLLPIPYTKATLQNVADHIDEVQATLGRQMLLENPSTYLSFAQSSYLEPDFIAEVARRTGCGLLLDVNNVHVASTNHARDAFAYIDRFPLAHVREIHLGGHAQESDEFDRPLLIDTHDRAVDPRVWALYRYVLDRIGPVPTLIEWDAHVPDWMTLTSEAARADAIVRHRANHEPVMTRAAS